MARGFVPRFLVEAGFLILLGVGSGLANLRDTVIVGVLVGGWLLVALIELAAWRAQTRPVATFVPPPLVQPEPEPAREEAPLREVSYPLRADAGAEPSGEVEAYTRVIVGEAEGEPPGRPADHE